ncbi:MAG: hypothetical protein DHS20C17_20300 [Cyclobacteriaceae bacterium]|nr:MAG: hypothetical protein DHS20C17_20300 [Cyclobacteriaceae bacterium]
MKKLIVSHGLITGGVVAAMLVFTFSGSPKEYANSELIGYTIMIIAFSTIFFATRSYRDKQPGGNMSFGQAFRVGLGITLVASIIYVIAWMVISNTIAKDYMTEYYQQSVEQLKTSGLSEAELTEKIEEIERFTELYKNPIVKISITFLEIFPVGFIVSLVSALILKRKT